MPFFYCVRAHEPLGSDFVGSVAAIINDQLCNSVKVALEMLKLQRHGLGSHVSEILLTKTRPFTVQSAVTTVLTKNKKSVGPLWAISLPKALESIFVQFARQNTVFRIKLDSVYRKHGADVEFLCISGARKDERLMSCGVKNKQLPENITPELVETFKGANLYGKMLTVVYRAFCLDHTLSDYYPYDDLVSLSREPPFQKTIAMVSDMVFRHVESVEGGDVFTADGKTCGKLAEKLVNSGIHLADYRLAIISVGPSDVIRFPGSWERSLSDLCDYLFGELQRSPNLKIIMNTHVAYPRWRGFLKRDWCATLYDFLVYYFSEYHQQVVLFDWTTYHDGNPFLDENLVPVRALRYTNEELFPNRKGMEKMIEEWAKSVPEVMCVKIGLADTAFPNGKW